jgi:hypothetical protein
MHPLIRCRFPGPQLRRPAIELADFVGDARGRYPRRQTPTVGNRAVDRDALPGQLAVRGNKVPSVGARLGRRSRGGRRGPSSVLIIGIC